MVDTICCENCGHRWPAEALEEIHDYWSRVDPGGVDRGVRGAGAEVVPLAVRVLTT